MKPFLVDGIGVILRSLSKISLFDAIISVAPKQAEDTEGALTEIWVVGNFALAVYSLFLFPLPPLTMVMQSLSIYPAFRVFEIIVFQFYTQIYGGYRREKVRVHYSVHSYRRSIILAFVLYLEIMIWFACIYRIYSDNFSKMEELLLTDPSIAIYFSAVTMTTIGYGDFRAVTTFGSLLITAQSMIGLFMTMLVLSRIITYLPRPSTRDPIEQYPKKQKGA